MPASGIIVNCPFDSCPLRPFAKVKASHCYTISLHGCRYCNFNFVIAVASDPNGNERLVAQWSLNSATGVYRSPKEYGRNPPGWLKLASAALPKHEPQEQKQEEGHSI